MATELEQRARFETWIGQLVNAPPTITVEQAGGAAGDGRYMSPDAALAWQAWQAALQQAQQPCPAFAAWFAEFDKQNHYPELLAREAWNAALRSQQPGGQAVAWPSGLLDRVKAAEQRIENGHAPRRIPADPSDVDLVLAEVRCLLEGSAPPFWLKSEAAAPPPLPEGVSEEDVRECAIAYMSGDTVTTDWKPQQWDMRRMRAALESYRARLAAKGGV